MRPVVPRPARSARSLPLLSCSLLLFTWAAAAQRNDAPATTTAERHQPIATEADRIEGRPGGITHASGSVRLGQATLRLDTPKLSYDVNSGLIVFDGGPVRWGRGQDLLEAQSGRWQTSDATGAFERPRFFFGSASAGGRGSLLRMLPGNRVVIQDARLTSCLADDQGTPLREPGTPVRAPGAKATGFAATTDLGDDPQQVLLNLQLSPALKAPPAAQDQPGWELRSPRITLDFDRQEGVAEQAQLRFLGVPLMVLPRLSFPLGEERRSGWLAPTARVDTRSGFEISAPYYLNLAPNQDATVTPALATRRGPSAEFEYRYLWTDHVGQFQFHALPNDPQLDRSRSAVNWQHQWTPSEWTVRTRGLLVSDDRYWKDFGHTQTFRSQTFASMNALSTGESAADAAAAAYGSMQPRLPAQLVQAERMWAWGTMFGQVYTRVLHWQPLQGTNPNEAFISPYQRSPQVGATLSTPLPGGLDFQLETEANRFTRPPVELDIAPQLRDGLRWHALGAISRPWISAAGWLIPKLSVNTATYRLDSPTPLGRSDFSRSIPTLSVDGGLNFERRWQWGTRDLVQTLEPRAVYVNTPMRDQRDLPNFDSAPKEFNSTSIFSENAFSGVDRVSDAHQLTLGLNSRALDAQTGAELLRGSIAQRIQLRDQTTTPAGTVANQRLSDLLLAATVGLSPFWGLDGTMQYNPDLQRTTRSVLSMRYSPAPGQTIAAAYRYARDSAETLELRANWPVWRTWDQAARGGAGACTLMITGAARLNYNTRESRMADSLLGLEIDSGCWIARLGLQRQSTGVTEEVTRLLLQLELSGLTRSRANPLRF